MIELVLATGTSKALAAADGTILTGLEGDLAGLAAIINSCPEILLAKRAILFSEIPLIFKVKSELSVRRAKQLIDEAMAADGLKQGRVTAKNWAKEL